MVDVHRNLLQGFFFYTNVPTKREAGLQREDCVKLTNVLCGVGWVVGYLYGSLKESRDSNKSSVAQSPVIVTLCLCTVSVQHRILHH